MICTCSQKDCYFVFKFNGRNTPDRCPDCGSRMVHPATPEEIAWFYQEHKDETNAG